jgi:DNA-directed RNA polymerase specialized sigma24 family protein
MEIGKGSTTMNRDEVVLDVLSHARRLIFNYSQAYQLDQEDLTQELACKLLEIWPKAVCKAFSDNALKAYLYSTIRNQLCKMVERYEKPLPLSQVEQTSTLDITCDIEQVDIIVEAVHRALRKCSAKVQAYAIKAYGLSYEPDIPLPEAKAGCVRTRSLREVFSRDERILALIG